MKSTKTALPIFVSLVLALGAAFWYTSLRSDEPPIPTLQTSVAEEDEAPIVQQPSFLQISELEAQLVLPEGLTLELQAEEHRRGSVASYAFASLEKHGQAPYFQELQVFTAESIQQFEQFCERETCFFGNYPTQEDYELSLSVFYGDEDSTRAYRLFHDQVYIVENLPCTGDSCVIRQYRTFIDDIMIDIWVNMSDQGQEAEADALFERFQIRE